MTPLLPVIGDRNTYTELFPQDSVWERSIQYLAEKHKLSGIPRRGVRGSHIVYRVGDSWIKIMAPMFSKDMAFEVAGLKCVEGHLSVDVPRILAQGTLEDWHYVILSHVDGERVGDVWSGFSLEEKSSVAGQIGSATLELQACSPDSVVKGRGDWKKFINAQLDGVVTHHQSKNLAPAWLSTLADFIGRFDRSEFVGNREVFLHADLTWDHFLVKRQNGAPVVSGVIDLADCRVGHPEYDIPASAAFIFKNQAEALRAYMLGLGYENAQLDGRMSEKLLAWTCLHFYSDLKNYFSKEMQEHSPGDFSSLARAVFPLDVVQR